MRVSVVVPAFRAERYLNELWACLERQTHPAFEVILVDDASPDQTATQAEKLGFRVVRHSKNKGPAAGRNSGIRAAQGELICFTDTDCQPDQHWIEALVARATREIDGHAFVGQTIIRPHTFLERCIGLLGFPGGGALGFQKVWRVTPQLTTTSFSSCNLAVTRRFLELVGGFDETFPVPAGEDTVLAKDFVAKGGVIHFCPEAIVVHESIGSLKRFTRWMLTRGRGNFHIARRNVPVGGFFKLRLWHLKNLIVATGPKLELPCVLALYGYMVLLQIIGFGLEKRAHGRRTAHA